MALVEGGGAGGRLPVAGSVEEEDAFVVGCDGDEASGDVDRVEALGVDACGLRFGQGE